MVRGPRGARAHSGGQRGGDLRLGGPGRDPDAPRVPRLEQRRAPVRGESAMALAVTPLRRVSNDILSLIRAVFNDV